MPMRAGGGRKGGRSAAGKAKAKNQAHGKLQGSGGGPGDFWDYKKVESAALEDENEVKEMLRHEKQPELAAVIKATVGREIKKEHVEVAREAFEEVISGMQQRRTLCWQLPWTLLYFTLYTYVVLSHEDIKNTASQERMLMSNVAQNAWGGVDDHFPVSGHYEMLDISEVGELWQYLHEAVLESLIPDLAEVDEPDVRRVFSFSQIIGGIQLQQIRREEKSCQEAHPNLGPKSASTGKNPLIKNVTCYPTNAYSNLCFGPGKDPNSSFAKAGFCSDSVIQQRRRAAEEALLQNQKQNNQENFADDTRRLAEERKRLNKAQRPNRTAASTLTGGIIDHFPRMVRRLFAAENTEPGVRGEYLQALTGGQFGGGIYSVLIHEHEGINKVTSKLRTLEDNEWLDLSTQWFGFKFLMLNPDLAVFTHVIINVWFSPSGQLLPGITLTSFQAEPYAAGMMSMLPDGAFGLLWVHLFLGVIVGNLRAGFQGELKQHMMKFWTWVEWLSMIGGMLVLGGWLLTIMSLTAIKDAAMQMSLIRPGAIDLWEFVSEDQEGQYNTMSEKLHAEVSSLAALLMFYRAFLNWYTLLLICRFFRVFEAQPRLAVVTHTVQHSLPDIGHFIVVLVSVWISFAVAGMFLFGHRTLEFAHLGIAMHNTGLIILGGWDYELLAEEHPLTAFLWVAAFITLLFLVLMNMALAIVMDVHSEVNSAASSSEELWTQIARGILGLWSHRDWVSLGRIQKGVSEMPPEVEHINMENLMSAVEGLPQQQAADMLDRVEHHINQEDEGGLSMSDAMSMVGWITHAVQQIYDKVDFLQMLEEDSVRMVKAWTKHLPSDTHGPLVFIDFDAHSDARLQVLEKRLGTMADIINENMSCAVTNGKAMQNSIVIIEDLTRAVPRNNSLEPPPRWSPGEAGQSRGPGPGPSGRSNGFNNGHNNGFHRSQSNNGFNTGYNNGYNNGYSSTPRRGGDRGGQGNDPWALVERPQKATYDQSRSGSSDRGFPSRPVNSFNV